MSDIFPYLILFLPLIASVFCFLINFKKSDFLIFISSIILILGLIVKLSFNGGNAGVIKGDAGLGILSIPTEYYLDSLSLFFLAIVILARIIMAFSYKLDVANSLNHDNRQLFYVVGLLNLFGVVGIFLSNNIFNLFIFIQIYCLTFCAIMAMSSDVDLTKLAFKYFCLNVVSSIVLLIAFVLLYSGAGYAQISEIYGVIAQKKSLINWLFLPIALTILCQFFPVWFYFKKVKSQDSLVGFLISFAFVFNSAIGFYLLIRFLFYMFNADLIFLNLKLDFALTIFGVLIILYSNYKISKSEYFTDIAMFLALNVLGFVIISIGGFSSMRQPSSLFYIANLVLVNLGFFIFANFLRKNFTDCHIKNINLHIKQDWQILLAILLLMMLPMPIGLMFWGNWNLIFEANNYFLPLMAIFISSLAVINLALRIVNYHTK